jgi:NAD(P)-dependent dehydrogenase (short-subunit alcohol dehydrogenase family)
MQISASSAIVVGGAGGLGEATVRRLHAAGAKVVVADLTDDKGKELASELGARYVRTDATDGVRGVRAEHCRKTTTSMAKWCALTVRCGSRRNELRAQQPADVVAK